MYFRYLLKKYFKSFMLVFLGLSFLYVIVDFMFNYAKLPSSSNLQVLYAFYVFIYASYTLFPLAIIFGFLLSVSSMIKFNEFVSFYSLGFRPKKLLKPFLIFALSVTALMYLLQSSKLAYANQYATSIKENFNYKTYNLFLKYKNNIVYIKSINPFSKMAWGIKVFEIKNRKITKVIYAKRAVFENDKWKTKNAEIMTLKQNVWQKEQKPLVFLENFTPKILSNLKTLDNISFYDAYITIRYFKDIDLNMILSIVFFKIFTPLLMIAFLIYLFFTAPIHVRISNVSLFMIKSVTFSVLLWAGELLIFKFAKQGILPFWTLAVPFLAIVVIDFLVIRRSYD
ncbi:MAG: LptF/LptG family permease [Epsilonproteobacteria bacterium]|nr:LptF/LptG family permease [Campylobacterota bacterium]